MTPEEVDEHLRQVGRWAVDLAESRLTYSEAHDVLEVLSDLRQFLAVSKARQSRPRSAYAPTRVGDLATPTDRPRGESRKDRLRRHRQHGV